MVSKSNLQKAHEPVMVGEVLWALNIDGVAHLKVGSFIDATLGFGGHSKEIIKKNCRVLGIDEDEVALKHAESGLKKACPSDYQGVVRYFKLVQGNFSNIFKIAKDNGFTQVDGILYDLGVSSYQITSKDRGFSFKHKDAPLDMRINPESQGVRASDLLNALDRRSLEELFSKVLSFDKARMISKKIVERRKEKSFEKVSDFLEIIDLKNKGIAKIHPATKPFMALRMAVNSELENLKDSLPQAFKLLKKAGRLVVISFHSGEDKIVKDFFKEMENKNLAQIITKKPLLPTKDEVSKNKRSRSAKLRALEKI